MSSLSPALHADSIEVAGLCLSCVWLVGLTFGLLVTTLSLPKGPGVPRDPIRHVHRLPLYICGSLGRGLHADSMEMGKLWLSHV